ncbi:hypothetical protein D1872_313350 [compost metagenome]
MARHHDQCLAEPLKDTCRDDGGEVIRETAREGCSAEKCYAEGKNRLGAKTLDQILCHEQGDRRRDHV